MKLIVGGIVGSAIVAVIVLSVILMPNQTEAVQDYLKKESMHPCQKAIINNFELYKENASLLQTPGVSKEELEKFAEEFPIKQEEYKQKLIDNDCVNIEAAKSGELIPKGDWYTLEFKEKMKALLIKGFD